MKKVITLLIALFPFAVFSCTTFVLKDGHNLVFGRNLDWVSDDGIIVTNQRNVLKTSLVFPPEKAVTWKSKYGSITFNQFGKEFPFGGINEKGLVVEVMVVAGSYPKIDKRPAINESQWVQYQLDNSETIEEVINSDKKIRISRINQSLHYLVCDKNGNTAVIEFTKNRMQVYTGESLKHPVLENDRYKKSLEKHAANKKCRFSGAAKLVSEYDSNNDISTVDYSFDILDKVKLDASWSIVYDIKNMQIHFNTSSNRDIKTININAFDFDCKTNNMAFDLMNKNNGDVTSLFVPFNSQLNKQKLNSAFKSNGVRFPEIIVEHIYGYSSTCRCRKN